MRIPIFCTRLEPLQALAGPWADYFSPNENPQVVAQQIYKRLNSTPTYRLQVYVRQNFTWSAVYLNRIKPLLEQS